MDRCLPPVFYQRIIEKEGRVDLITYTIITQMTTDKGGGELRIQKERHIF